MLSTGLDIFVQDPQKTAARELLPAKVTGVNNNVYTIELKKSDVALEAGGELLLFYDHDRKFVQQSARVETVESTIPSLVAAIVLVGEPVSAESRESSRVSLALAGLTAKFGTEESCQLNDVSITGFSLTALQRYKIGEHVPATLEFEGQSFSGASCIQSVRELGDGRIRYGVHCVNDEKFGGFELQRGLRHIASTIQRQQMRRLSGSE
jgi:hypothetical protein